MLCVHNLCSIYSIKYPCQLRALHLITLKYHTHTQLNKIIISYEMIIKYNNGIVVFIFSNRRAGFKDNESHARVYFLYLPPHIIIVMNHSTAAMALRQHTI